VPDRIQILRRMNLAFNAREPDWTRPYSEDVEFVMPPDWPDDHVFRGREGIERVADLWEEQLDDYEWEEERLIEAPECVVGLYRHRGRIHGTDQHVEAEVGALFHFSGDEIVRVVSFGKWADALAAAGLEA
jgi:ketosteroid isomerase-like protein